VFDRVPAGQKNRTTFFRKDIVRKISEIFAGWNSIYSNNTWKENNSELESNQYILSHVSFVPENN